MSATDLQREAQKLEAAKRYAEAGAIWEQLHEVDRAVSAYKLGGRVDKAAVCLEQDGRKVDAAGAYLASGNHARAAALYAAVRDFASAARAHLRGNQREQAATCFERAEAFEDAARLYAVIGNIDRAIELYERAGKPERGRELATKHGKATTPEVTDPVALAEAMLRGDALMDLDHVTRVVMQLVIGGRLPEAAKLYSHCREDIGFPLIAMARGKREIELQLARMLAGAKDFHKAAEVLESLGNFEQAAQLFERSGDYAAAAEGFARAGASASAAAMFERCGQTRHAAELYLEVGEKARAAACYEHAQEYARAGRLYFELGRGQQALQLLQRVQPDHPDHLEAARMIGELLARGGHRMVAIKRYIQLLRGNEITDANAPLFMHTAELLHAEGRAPQARAIYERIAAWRVDYGDVQTKLQSLGQPAALAPEVEETTERAPLVSIMDGFEVIKDTPLFRELSLDEAREFYDRADRRKLAGGDVLIEQDQPGQGLLVIKSGAAKVLKVTAQGTTELARLGAGSPIGEMSLFDASPTSARVVAEGEVEVFVLPRQRFEELVRSSDQLALKIYRVFIQILSERLRKASVAK